MDSELIYLMTIFIRVEIKLEIVKVTQHFFGYGLGTHLVHGSRPNCVRASVQNPNRSFLLQFEILRLAQLDQGLGGDVGLGGGDAQGQVSFSLLILAVL